MDNLLARLITDFPKVNFRAGKVFFYSPPKNEVVYIEPLESNQGIYSIMHELGHASLGHKDYNSDIELLQLEVSAWNRASIISEKYGYKINSDHLQDCLDTYRDWLHHRSKCPNCLNNSFQLNSNKYKCFNCHVEWKVSSSVLCRPYRLLKRRTKETSPESNEFRTMFV